MFGRFSHRSERLERIDTGDYTAEEYEEFLSDIRLVNRYIGDNRTLGRTLLSEIERKNLKSFSVLDVGAGSGELLRVCGRFARKTQRNAKLFGLELNERSAVSILEESKDFSEITAIRGDALNLPFANRSFDFVICSLFTHHFDNEDIIKILKSMSRIARRKVFVIDLHRHVLAYYSYKMFANIFLKGSLVKQDGALSVLRGFKPAELEKLVSKAELKKATVKRYFPFRLVLEFET